jgi:RHS repeat-associated protein
VAYTYDALGRVTSEESRGFTHEYAYDLGGNRVATAFGTGRSETRAYDALNRPVGITENGRTTSYYYDLAGRAVGQLSGNGQWGTSHYDALGRLVRRTLREGTGGAQPVVAELTFHYDAVGNLRQQEEWWPGEISRSGVRTTTLSYDSADRLRQELVNEGVNQTSTSYSYDGVGNRGTKTVHSNGALQKHFGYGTNGRNQLTSWSEWNGSGVLQRSATLTYDAAGNRITQSITPAGGSAQLTTYAWDYDNRLTSVTLPGSVTHSYGCDYRMRRVTRSEPGENPVAMTFSGGLSVAEYEVTDPLLGTLGVSPEVEYQRGPDMGGGVGGLLYSLRSGTPKFNLGNGRGDVVAQSDSTGDLTWTASYEAYGKRTVETGSNADRQRANTKEEDPTGLLNEGFRYRDLETGTWLSRDPAGFVDGPNLYAYVTQNPWSKFDPDGLFWAFAVDAGFAAWDVYQYTSGNISHAEYNQRMAITIASVALNAVAGGGFTGGGLVAQATGRAAIKAALSPATRAAASTLIQTASHIEDFQKAGQAFNSLHNRSDDASSDANTGAGPSSEPSSGGSSSPTKEGGLRIDTTVEYSASELNAQLAKAAPDVKTGKGYDAGDTPVRIEGIWSLNDMKQGLLGHPPNGLGTPDLHHGGQLPGAAKHEVVPDLHRNNSALHPNRYNQGVTPEMRQSDRQLHWWYRAREQGADQLLKDWIYDN